MFGAKLSFVLLVLHNGFQSIICQGTGCPQCSPGETCYYVREGNQQAQLSCITMEEAIMLHRAQNGGPSGPGTGIQPTVPAQPPQPQPQPFEAFPQLSTLGIGAAPSPGQPQGFEERFRQGIGAGAVIPGQQGLIPGQQGLMPGQQGLGMGGLMPGQQGLGMGGLMPGQQGLGMGGLMPGQPGLGMGGLTGSGMPAMPGQGLGMGGLAGSGMSAVPGAGFPAPGGLPFSPTGFGPGSGVPPMQSPGFMPGSTSTAIDPTTGESVMLNPSAGVGGGTRSSLMHAHGQTVARPQGGGGAVRQRGLPGEINQSPVGGAGIPLSEMSSPTSGSAAEGRVSNILEDESGFLYLFYPRAESVGVRVNITKEGYCRRDVRPRGRNNCMNSCYSDSQCRRDLKCCPSGCALKCLRPNRSRTSRTV